MYHITNTFVSKYLHHYYLHVPHHQYNHFQDINHMFHFVIRKNPTYFNYSLKKEKTNDWRQKYGVLLLLLQVFLLLQIESSVITVFFVCERFLHNYELRTSLRQVFTVIVLVNIYLQRIFLTQSLCRYFCDMPPYQISTPCLVISSGSFLESKDTGQWKENSPYLVTRLRIN
jgi:hypothetical protein